MPIVNDPREVIYHINENRNALGINRQVTSAYCPPINENRHGICVQLRQFFGELALHYEIEEYGGGINVEIHSETRTPQEVHEFLRSQFDTISKGGNGSYRFATHRIAWRGRPPSDVVADIKKAVDDLYKTYDAYLSYVKSFFDNHDTMNGCRSYDTFKEDEGI